MADGHASTSSCSGARNTTKRKMVSTSDHESGDSVFSPTGKRYKLRASTVHGFVFAGNALSANEMSSTGSTCTIRGPATSYWGPAHVNRLNFKKTVQINIVPSRERILRFLYEPYKYCKKKVFGPEILTKAMEEKIMEACTATGNPILEYIEEVFSYIRRNGVSWEHEASNRSKEEIAEIETYVDNKITEDQESCESAIQKETALLAHIRACLLQALSVCYIDKKPERQLDKMMVLVMQLAQFQDHKKTYYFNISETGQSEVKFEICGSLVTSMTNILWEARYKGKQLTKSFPVMMCDNKGNYTEVESEGKQTAKKRTSVHMKLPQVIGQCISMADQSIFETEDYKIVYHVSLMSTHKVVITRTHVAKSTLKVIKDGCPIPDQNDLDPSYVFETSLYVHNDWEDLIRLLYITLQIFEKLGYTIVTS